jgi:isopentenyl diphosphate isomerase/L-lactate dehydrogenase-like FMN-dependent dehydrogenase
MSGVDALKAVGSGASAIWVQSDNPISASPISSLRNIVYTLRGHHMMTEVFFSGGVRRGSDILKACAFGANGVFLDPEAALWGLF